MRNNNLVVFCSLKILEKKATLKSLALVIIQVGLSFIDLLGEALFRDLGALAKSEVRDEAELANPQESFGTTGSKLASGSSKAVKELETEQKIRANRVVRDFLDAFLLDITNLYRDVLATQFETKTQNQKILHSISTILEPRIRLHKHSSPNLTIESLFLDLRNV
jgi:DNA polymerase-3 subunit delta'